MLSTSKRRCGKGSWGVLDFLLQQSITQEGPFLADSAISSDPNYRLLCSRFRSQTLNFGLFRYLKSVVQLNSQISYGAFQFGMSEQ